MKEQRSMVNLQFCTRQRLQLGNQWDNANEKKKKKKKVEFANRNTKLYVNIRSYLANKQIKAKQTVSPDFLYWCALTLEIWKSL